MEKLASLLLILSTLTGTSLSIIQINFQQTQATLYTNDNLLIKFTLQNQTTPYQLKYSALPNNWQPIKNDLLIKNISKQPQQEWTFDLTITDQDGDRLVQTIKLMMKDYYVTITPVTLASLGRAGGKGVGNAGTVAGAASMGLPASVFNLTDLINRYPGIKQSSLNGSPYLTNNLVASSIITPIIISTAQAAYNPARDSRPISLSQIKRNAAMYRQNNANKAIANLIFIIQNLNANLNEAKTNLNLETNRFQYMKESAFNCSQAVYALEDKLAKIKNAVDDRGIKIGQEKVQAAAVGKLLDELRNNLTTLYGQKFDIQRTINPQGLSLIQSQKQITQCENQLKTTTTQLDSIRDTIRSNKLDINVATDNMEDSNKKLKNVNASLQIVRQTITDLKRQLAEAQDQELSLMKEQIFYIAVPVQNRIRIQNLVRKNGELDGQVQGLVAKVAADQKICDQNKQNVRVKKQSISQRQQKYSTILLNIETNKNKTTTLESQLKQRNSNADSLTVQINALNKELEKSSLSLTQQKYICAVADERKAKQQTKLDQISASIEENSKALQESNRYLEMARAEKELADLAVEEIIRTSTNVTLYPIVPNGGSTILGGSPLGNNPSGSALGPSFRVESIQKGSLDIKNLTNFLSQIYQMNIDPTQILKAMSATEKASQSANQPLTTVYPMDTSSRSKIVDPSLQPSTDSSIKSFNCESSSTIQNRSGIIEQVTLGSIIVRDNLNQKYTLSISLCTKIASTKSGNFFATGNKIFFTGVQLFNVYSNTIFDAYSILIVPQ